MRARAFSIVLLSAFALVLPGAATAAGLPVVASSAVEGVSANAVTLRAKINPEGLATAYRFEYLSAAEYAANLAAIPPRAAFFGARFAPASGSGNAGSGFTPVTVSQHIVGLTPSTAYRYRVRASNSAGTIFGPDRPFATQDPTNVFTLLDGRGWEMVSPIAKNGGSVQPPGAIAGGGVFQAAIGGGAITYSSADSFFAAAVGAPGGSQYVSSRGAGGWATADITTQVLSGSYGSEPDGVPYQLFAPDLSQALLSNGERCRGEVGGPCPVANPPLPGSAAPSGYRDYYLRSVSGGFQSLLSEADLLYTPLEPTEFELRLVAASPDLSQVLLSSCAALTAEATEVTAPGGCEEAAQNLYRWSAGELTLVNLLPGQTTGAPGAAVAAQAGALSDEGARVYWTEGGSLYLREGNQTKPVDAAQGGGGEFQTASNDGATAYFTHAGDLFRFSAVAGTATALTTSGEVEGVLGVSKNGSQVYYGTPAGIFRAEGATTTAVAEPGAALPGDYLPPTGAGTARVSDDGLHLLFLSDAELTGYPSEGETEAFLYGPPPGDDAPTLTCVSCNPSGERPEGGASIPGTIANGSGSGALDVYQPRALAANGNRVFFDSASPLVQQDTNHRDDVYEWEAAGVGSCTRAGGCVGLISSGRSPEDSLFLDASADGSDAFFLTAASLYTPDPGAYDVYVAREGGGFPVPQEPIPCDGDACQTLPEAPEDPTPGTLVPNAGNPPLRIAKPPSKGKKKKNRKHKRKHRKAHSKKAAYRDGRR